MSNFNEQHSYLVSEKSSLIINGSTNFSVFSCRCNGVFPLQKFTIASRSNPSSYTFKNTILNIPVNSLDCGNMLMNKEMHKALNGSQHPNIVIELTTAILNHPRGLIEHTNWTALKAQTIVSINGVSHKYWLDINAQNIADKHYRFIGEKKLMMTDFKVKPPVAMLGMVRVEDEITVGLDIEITFK